MKAICISPVRVDGCQFDADKEYEFEEQQFTEVYDPAIHPRPARGYHILYHRYKATYVVEPFTMKSEHDMTEVRIVYFYDHAYCQHHDWHDERGHTTACFNDHFAVVMPNNNRFVKQQKKQLYTRNPLGTMEIPKKLKQQMQVEYPEWLQKVLGMPGWKRVNKCPYWNYGWNCGLDYRKRCEGCEKADWQMERDEQTTKE